MPDVPWARHSTVERHIAQLAPLTSAQRERHALADSGLPGPRANLELIAALAEISDEPTLRRWAALSPDDAPGDRPPLLLVAAGTVGLGRLLAADGRVLGELKVAAADPRWRVREAAAMGLQAFGVAQPQALLEYLRPWAADADPLVQRAAVAALCEPALLAEPAIACAVVGLLDDVTRSLVGRRERRAEPVRVLRQALGYAWSVAIGACPGQGQPAFERWLASDDPDVRWIVRQNLAKKRLQKCAAEWLATIRGQPAARPQQPQTRPQTRTTASR